MRPLVPAVIFVTLTVSGCGPEPTPAATGGGGSTPSPVSTAPRPASPSSTSAAPTWAATGNLRAPKAWQDVCVLSHGDMARFWGSTPSSNFHGSDVAGLDCYYGLGSGRSDESVELNWTPLPAEYGATGGNALSCQAVATAMNRQAQEWAQSFRWTCSVTSAHTLRLDNTGRSNNLFLVVPARAAMLQVVHPLGASKERVSAFVDLLEQQMV